MFYIDPGAIIHLRWSCYNLTIVQCLPNSPRAHHHHGINIAFLGWELEARRVSLVSTHPNYDQPHAAPETVWHSWEVSSSPSLYDHKLIMTNPMLCLRHWDSMTTSRGSHCHHSLDHCMIISCLLKSCFKRVAKKLPTQSWLWSTMNSFDIASSSVPITYCIQLHHLLDRIIGNNRIRYDLLRSIGKRLNWPWSSPWSSDFDPPALCKIVMPLLPLLWKTPTVAAGSNLAPSTETLVIACCFSNKSVETPYKSRTNLRSYPTHSAVYEQAEPGIPEVRVVTNIATVWYHCDTTYKQCHCVLALAGCITGGVSYAGMELWLAVEVCSMKMVIYDGMHFQPIAFSQKLLLMEDIYFQL